VTIVTWTVAAVAGIFGALFLGFLGLMGVLYVNLRLHMRKCSGCEDCDPYWDRYGVFDEDPPYSIYTDPLWTRWTWDEIKDLSLGSDGKAIHFSLQKHTPKNWEVS
jgi:hypothetical protein